MHRHTGTIYMHTQRHMHKHIYRHIWTAAHIHTHMHTQIHTDIHAQTPAQTHTQVAKDWIWGSLSSSAELPFIKTDVMSLILQSLPRLFNTPGPQRVGAYQGKSKQRLCPVSPTGSVALLSRRYGDRDWLPLGLGRWRERYLVWDEAWNPSWGVRNPTQEALRLQWIPGGKEAPHLAWSRQSPVWAGSWAWVW